MAQISNWKTFLYDRGIKDASIEKYRLSGTDTNLTIPVRDKDGRHLFNKYRVLNPKQYLYDKGAKATLFGLEFINSSWVVLCEGELDAIRLDSVEIPAISGTGGCGTFKSEWLQLLPKSVFICYDTDEAGKEAAVRVHLKIPGSRIVHLPEGKDVTDYLQNHTRDDFKKLLKESTTIPKPPREINFTRMTGGNEIERAKAYPIENLIEFTKRKAPCIWHNEKTGSLHLYKDNHVYCFGCSKGGDAIDVYKTLNNVSFGEAVNYLATH